MFRSIRRMARKLVMFSFRGLFVARRFGTFGGWTSGGGQRSDSPHDPYARVPACPRRGPHLRGGAVAVAEPDEDTTVTAVGAYRRRK